MKQKTGKERYVNSYVRAKSKEKNKEFVKYGCVGKDLGCWEYWKSFFAIENKRIKIWAAVCFSLRYLSIFSFFIDNFICFSIFVTM